MCGHVTAQQVQQGVHPHTHRCQKFQRRARRLPQMQLQIDDRAEFCWTPGCRRASKAGFDACCSSCRLSSGASHSRRCRDHQGNTETHLGPTTAAATGELDRNGLPCNRWIDRPLASWYAKTDAGDDLDRGSGNGNGRALTQLDGAVSSNQQELGSTTAEIAAGSTVFIDGHSDTAREDSRMLAQVDFAEMD